LKLNFSAFIFLIPTLILASELNINDNTRNIDNSKSNNPESNNRNNYRELNEKLNKAQRNVDFTFSPWLKNSDKQTNKNKHNNNSKKRKSSRNRYKNYNDTQNKKYDFKISAGMQYNIISSNCNILYKTHRNNDTLNLNKDLNINPLSNSIVIPVISITLNKKHNLFFSSYSHTSLGTKSFDNNIVFNGQNYSKSNSKFEYSEYDFEYKKDFGFYDLGLGYKSIELMTTLDDGINIESANSKISYPYVLSSLKTIVFNNNLDFIANFSFFGKELYYKLGSQLKIKHHKNNSIGIGIFYTGYNYKYTNLEANGNDIDFTVSYLIGFN
jgi:hypothetical protein